HLFRARFLWNGTLHECLRLWNYSRTTVALSLTFDLDADFADIFEVRGTRRERRGTRLGPIVDGTEMRLGYRGLDNEDRWTVIEWSEPSLSMTPGAARFDYNLEPHAPAALLVAIRCERARRPIAPMAFTLAQSQLNNALDTSRTEYAVIDSSS